MKAKSMIKPQFHVIEINKNTTNENIQKALVKLINNLMIKEYFNIQNNID